MFSTDKPMTAELVKKLTELQGEPVARDERHALYNNVKPMTQRDGGDLARAQGEPVTLSLHEPDEVVTFDDGRMFQATPDGWLRIDPERPTIHQETPDHG